MMARVMAKRLHGEVGYRFLILKQGLEDHYMNKKDRDDSSRELKRLMNQQGHGMRRMMMIMIRLAQGEVFLFLCVLTIFFTAASP